MSHIEKTATIAEPNVKKMPKSKEGRKVEDFLARGLDNLLPSEREEYSTLCSMVEIQADLRFEDYDREPETSDFDKLAKKYANMDLGNGETSVLTETMAEGIYDKARIPSLKYLIEDALYYGIDSATLTGFEDGTRAIRFTRPKDGSQSHCYMNEIQGKGVFILYDSHPEHPVSGISVFEKNQQTGEMDEVFSADNIGSWSRYSGDENERVSEFGDRVLNWESDGTGYHRETNFSGLLNEVQGAKNYYDSRYLVRAKDGVEVTGSWGDNYVAYSRLYHYESDLGWVGEKSTYAPGSDVVLTVENRYFYGDTDLSEYVHVAYRPSADSDREDRIICRGVDPVKIERANGEIINVPLGYKVKEEHGTGRKLVIRVVNKADGTELFKIDATERLLDAQNLALEKARQNRSAKTEEEYREILKSQYDGVFSPWARD